MKVGLLGDTHDKTDLVQVAADLFRDHGITRVIHLGDVTRAKTLAPLAGFDLTILQGNNDTATLPHLPLTWTGTLDGLRVGAAHGHQERVLRDLLVRGRHDVVLRGHSHRAGMVQQGRTLVVNPGALHRARVKSVAVLETGGPRVTFYSVGADGAREWTPPP